VYPLSSRSSGIHCSGTDLTRPSVKGHDCSGVAKGGGAWGVQPPIRIEAVFFHSRKVTVIKYYNDSKNNELAQFAQNQPFGGAIASMVERVLTWIREQYLVVCNIAK